MKKTILLFLFLLISCVEQETKIQFPDKIGANKLNSVIKGDSAVHEINELHGSGVATNQNIIVYYGNQKEDILYISKYRDKSRANSDLEKMIFKMQRAKNSPFGFIVPMKNYKNSYMTLGMGSVHYIYQSGDYLLWYTTKQKFYNKIPVDLTDFFPVKH